MNKISIITLVGANNIGAFLQAFALGKVFQGMGYAVEYLTIQDNTGRQGKLNKIIRYLKQKNVRMLLYKIKSSKKYSQARTQLAMMNYDKKKEYDTVVVGSDEMWNVSSRSFEHYQEYFGKGISAKRIISYAPSVGNATEKDLRKNTIDFSSFDSLSVRDQRTFHIVSNFDNRKVECVLDPTFLLDDYSGYLPVINCKKDFIMVYSYGIDNKEIKMAKNFAERVGLPLYSIGTYNAWCDKNIIVSPFEFLSYLKQAKYVITATFHGTALSINFNKQFVACLEESEKLKFLLQEFGLENRIVTEERTISDLFGYKIDYDSVNQCMKEKKEKSIAYLVNALLDNGIKEF